MMSQTLMMRHVVMAIGVCFWLALPVGASAQILVPPPTAMPPPPAPPPPKIEVPVVPQLDAPPQRPSARLQKRGSFGDRVSKCLDDGAAAGWDPADRATHSRACANQ